MLYGILWIVAGLLGSAGLCYIDYRQGLDLFVRDLGLLVFLSIIGGPVLLLGFPFYAMSKVNRVLIKGKK